MNLLPIRLVAITAVNRGNFFILQILSPHTPYVAQQLPGKDGIVKKLPQKSREPSMVPLGQLAHEASPSNSSVEVCPKYSADGGACTPIIPSCLNGRAPSHGELLVRQSFYGLSVEAVASVCPSVFFVHSKLGFPAFSSSAGTLKGEQGNGPHQPVKKSL